ncbi:AMP-binding enzyme [Arthrobacter sp. yr096]|uniref:AMP-binding protein n=1 Tax=Arthrobacter sp. yr096 TaxID=1761750 RepID=UPI0008B4ED83|nr:AMP-binding protein [Arthrobacter sp. yr096]SEJ61651.1 AMP-binding enzyme [Arthrobacter sp. yr096]
MHPLVSAIHDVARHHPGKVALRWNCHDFPYAAVDRQINTRALAMQLKGVRAGELVAFAAAPGPDSLVESAALWALGAAGLPLHSGAEGTLPAHAILEQATGFMHPDGDYLKAAPGSGTAPSFPPAVWLHEEPAAGPTAVDLQEFTAVLEGAEKRFSLSTRTVLGLSSMVHPGSMIDVWAVLAAGGTVDLINHHESLTGDCLGQHLRETEADLLVVPSALPRRLRDVPGAVFAQFRDVMVLEPFDRNSRTALADAFPCAIFHHWDPSTAFEDMSDYCPADFVAGTNHQPKDSHA